MATTLLGVLFLAVTCVGLWLLRPRSKKLQRSIWLLFVTGVLLFIASIVMYTYSIEPLFVETPQYSLPVGWMWTSLVGAGVGFASVVGSFVVTIIARMNKK